MLSARLREKPGPEVGMLGNFRVEGLRFRVWGLGFWVSCFGMVWVLGSSWQVESTVF